MHWITVEKQRWEGENVFLIISVWENQILDVFSLETVLVIYSFLWNFAVSIDFYYNFFPLFYSNEADVKYYKASRYQPPGVFQDIEQMYICAIG